MMLLGVSNGFYNSNSFRVCVLAFELGIIKVTFEKGFTSSFNMPARVIADPFFLSICAIDVVYVVVG